MTEGGAAEAAPLLLHGRLPSLGELLVEGVVELARSSTESGFFFGKRFLRAIANMPSHAGKRATQDEAQSIARATSPSLEGRASPSDDAAREHLLTRSDSVTSSLDSLSQPPVG